VKPYNSIIVLGPTASGKTRLAAHLALENNGAVLSFDSRQVYKNLDIGTGKDLNEFSINGKEIPYYLIDCCDINANFHSYEFVKNYILAFNHCIANNTLPILCGGTGLYFDLVLKKHQYINIPVNASLRTELDQLSDADLKIFLGKFNKEYTSQADVSTRKRIIRAIEIATFLSNNLHQPISYPELKPLIIGIKSDVNVRNRRIEIRLKERISSGMIEEVDQILKSGISPERLIFLGLEYRYITEFLLGKYDKNKMLELLQIAITQFAKRQMTWFRKMEREGFEIHWINATSSIEEQMQEVKTLL